MFFIACNVPPQLPLILTLTLGSEADAPCVNIHPGLSKLRAHVLTLGMAMHPLLSRITTCDWISLACSVYKIPVLLLLLQMLFHTKEY